ncbi:PREDICTED: spermatogenesis-associated protein 24 [Elephantulus edwardii]|uniref:spermatogenesis-associated protein 24 n=1 Tax=Elephantulus edwardii TaxID=28737 RepID=UPI0003F05AA6|nr:PREDICTED: spermatogenesis-associated protein 24 [Elephantulus edwardii]
MATPDGWSQGGTGSVCLAFDQLRDVIESQEELIHQLRNVMVLQDENFVSKEEFQAVEEQLVEEKAAHAKTKVLLAKEEEKLQFALGEIEVLSKQLEKEKLAFEKALSNVKSKVLQESSKKDQLITKCNEIESHIIKQEDILNGKENEIKELQQVISQQKQILRNQMSDFRIQKQQENYMARVLDQKHRKSSGTRQARSLPLREK